MSNPILLYLNGVEVGDNMEWDATTEEILGGIGRATFTIQDRTNSYEPQCHWDVKAVIAATGWVLYRGEIITEPIMLVDGMPWRKWQISCADANYELDWRLVGAIDGTVWEDEDGYGDWIAIDPYANSLADDAQTVQALFDHYFRFNGDAVGTSTYVETNLAPGSFAPVFWTYSTLRGALDDMAALVAGNLQHGITPDLEEHWQILPAWYELVGGSTTTIFPTVPGGLGSAPMDVDNDTPGSGVSSLSWTFDGSAMPDQVYVKGATGFSRSGGTGDFGTGDTGPAPSPAGKYTVTIDDDTNLYSADSTGYILDDLTPPTIPAGEVVSANVVVFPRKPTGEHHGGSFYKVLTGPYAGGYISSSTNTLGYGSISVASAAAAPLPGPPPVVTGIGGSGWTYSVTQDPNKRQAYFDAPLSVDKAGRDSIGGQQLYRGMFPTLRGTMVLTGANSVDGWRTWSTVGIHDHRMPDSMNGKRFLIQRIGTEFYQGGVRKYTIDWGDGPTQRASAQPHPRPRVPEPAVQLLITAPDLGPNPHDSQIITAQLVDRSSNAPWKIPGKVVQWNLTVVDKFGNPVHGQGSLDPLVSTTNRSGTARTVLTAGSRTGLRYSVDGDIPVS